MFRSVVGFMFAFTSMTLARVALTGMALATSVTLTISVVTSSSTAHNVPFADRTRDFGGALVNDDFPAFNDLAAIWRWRRTLNLINSF